VAYEGLEAVKSLDYKLIDPTRLSAIRRRSIEELIKHSLQWDFPERMGEEVQHAQMELEKRRKRLGKIMPGGAPHTWQRHAKPLGVLAIDKHDNVRAYLVAADNVSTAIRPPAGRMEMRVKQWFGSEHIWHWLGIRAIDPELLTTNEPVENVVNVVDVMAYLTTTAKKPKQPVSAYLWPGEQEWQQSLESWGLQPDGSEAQHVKDFGPNATPVLQERWVIEGNGIKTLQENITGKLEAEAALAHVAINLGLKRT
jgi:hypothetical protein